MKNKAETHIVSSGVHVRYILWPSNLKFYARQVTHRHVSARAEHRLIIAPIVLTAKMVNFNFLSKELGAREDNTFARKEVTNSKSFNT